MKYIDVEVSTVRPGHTVSIWWRTQHGGSAGQGGTVASVTEAALSLRTPLGDELSWPLADFASGAAWVEVEVPFGAEECVMHGPDCSGPVNMHSVGRSRSMPRCATHARLREESYENSSERYADSDLVPSWFDPTYAGERWDED